LSWYRETRSKVYEGFRWLLSPLVKGFVRLEMPPAVITTAGILFTVIAFILMYRGWSNGNGWGLMRAAGGVILFAAAWDTVDGEVARALGKTSPKGAFLDSVLDRLSEFIIYLGILLFANLSTLDSVLLFALLFTSFSISYLRARAEGVGIDCSVGVFDRATRVFIIGVALIAIPAHMNWVIRGLLLGTAFTAARRFIYVLTRKAKA